MNPSPFVVMKKKSVAMIRVLAVLAKSTKSATEPNCYLGFEAVASHGKSRISLNVEAEVGDVAVFHDVFFAFETILSKPFSFTACSDLSSNKLSQ
jgi:hypothetical protein